MKGKEIKSKRTFVLRLDEGEDFIRSVKDFAKNNKINSGYFTAVGCFKNVNYGLFHGGEYKVIKKQAKDCFEILSAVGNITIKEDDILVHCHINASDEEDGTAFGGHLMEESKIFPVAEIFIQEIEPNIIRKYNTKLKLWTIEP